MYLDYNHGAYPVQYNQHFQKITYTWSTGAYIISKRGYRKLLKVTMPCEWTISSRRHDPRSRAECSAEV